MAGYLWGFKLWAANASPHKVQSHLQATGFLFSLALARMAGWGHEESHLQQVLCCCQKGMLQMSGRQ